MDIQDMILAKDKQLPRSERLGANCGLRYVSAAAPFLAQGDRAASFSGSDWHIKTGKGNVCVSVCLCVCMSVCLYSEGACARERRWESGERESEKDRKGEMD